MLLAHVNFKTLRGTADSLLQRTVQVRRDAAMAAQAGRPSMEGGAP